MALLGQPILVLLACTTGLGIFLLIAGPALGPARADLVTRLRRLDPELWWEEPEAPPSPAAFLRPLGHDAVRLAGRVLGALGLIAIGIFHRPLPLGPGYVGIGLAARGQLGVGMLVALLAMKMVATPTTTGGNGVGGLFFPAVMMGAAAGGALGHVVPGPASLFAVVGMAAFLGGAYKVPLAGVAFVAEATGAPGYIIPGLLAAALGYLFSGPDSLSGHQRART
jgi:H+/Cl- antiporter ClcA